MIHLAYLRRLRILGDGDELDACIIHKVAYLDVLEVARHINQNVCQFRLHHIVYHLFECIQPRRKSCLAVCPI